MTEKEFLKLVGRNIASHRKQLGMNQSQFATKLGMKLITIASIECGQSGTTIKTLKKMADALNVAPLMLMTDSDHIILAKHELTKVKEERS